MINQFPSGEDATMYNEVLTLLPSRSGSLLMVMIIIR